MAVNGIWTDLIADFMELTEGAFSPDIFRLWSAISLVAGAAERRIWIKMGSRTTYANLYVMLVAPPGVGKYIIELVRDLWADTMEPGTKVKAFHSAPDNTSKASLLDQLAKAKGSYFPRIGPMVTYHSLLVAAEEMGVLLPAYDTEYIGVLNSIYNNKPYYHETRRTGSVRELEIESPQLNILAGAQPGWLASTFPEEAWSMGLTRRLIMVYAPETPRKDLFADASAPESTRQRLLAKLGQLSQLHGQMKWHVEAAKAVADWHMAGGPPEPTHSKLAHYNRSRTSLHLPKLAMVSALARTGHLQIDPVDVERAKRWLLEAEVLMPDIFRAMVGKSDTQVIEELHFFLTALWVKNKREPVHEKAIFSFLAQRVPSDKVEKLVAIAERADIIARMAGTDTYVPRPRHEHGLE